MALLKTTTIKGIEANYWVVTGYLSNKVNNTTIVDLRLYKDKQSRQESLQNHVDSIQVEVLGYNLSLDQIYPLIKSAYTPMDTTIEIDDRQENVPFFSDAESD